MTSTIAEVGLALFLPLAIAIFFTMRPLTATLVVALGGEMFLPVGPAFKIPYVPELSKYNLPYLCIMIGCLLTCARKVTKLPKQRWIPAMTLLALVGGAASGLTNGDVLTFGNVGQFVKPAMTLKDGFFVGISEFFPSWIAVYLGYSLIRDADDVDRVLIALAVAGLVYCPFAIVEMRMSPQFHSWVYGYDTGAFQETIRFGGYRPKVFMTHGLTLGRFFMVTTLALFVLARRRRNLLGLPVRLLAWFQLVVLVLCRSSGAIVLAVVGVLFVSFAKPKRQLLLAMILASVTLLYPLLRASDLFPVAGVLDAAGLLGEERRGSLAFRFYNEDLLLAHARERILFGWGTYGRNRVFDADGRDMVVSDGHWVLALGIAGLAGFIVSFGMLLWPVIWARRRLGSHGSKGDGPQLAGLALIVSLATVDLIPNGLWAVYPYLLAGVLTRRLGELQPTSRDS